MQRPTAIVLMLGLLLSCGGCGSNAADTLAVGATSASFESDRSSESASSAQSSQPPARQTVTYDGVTIDVPASWPVIDGAHAPACANPFRDKPTVFVGQLLAAPSCPASADNSPTAKTDGVWLTKDGIAPPNAAPVTTGRGVTLLTEPGATSDALWIGGVTIQLGRGPDPSVAQAIEESIRLTPRTSDSPVQGFCPRDGTVSMPMPERLTKTLVLESGDVTLQPPRATDVAVVSARQIWSNAGQPEPAATYRLLLARYSARFPATMNKDGSTTPIDSDKLAWVVYAQAATTALGMCGGDGIASYDARTGQSIGSMGYSSGP